jgi:glycosyltransferase involved in cell wall biosynthesis
MERPLKTMDTENEPRPELSIIVPCLNEEKTITPFLNSVLPVVERLVESGRWEIIFVNDGSTDATESLISAANRLNPRVWGVSLTRNFGHQPAIFAGLGRSRGEIVAILDADLQDPPEVLEQLIVHVRSGQADIAFGIRQKRDGNPFLRLCYRAFYRLMNQISEHEWQLDAGDFCALNRRATDLILAMPETDRFFRGLRSWIGLRQSGIPYHRPKRAHGVTKYNLSRLIRLAMKGIVGFSTAPLRIASYLSLVLAAASAITGGLLILNRFFPAFTLFGYHIGANPGIATIAIIQMFVSSAVLASLGIIGEYLSVLVIEVKRRPQSLVSHEIRQ